MSTLNHSSSPQKKHPWLKSALGMLGFVALGFVAYFNQSNPYLFKADLIEGSAPGANTDAIYIPNYTAVAGDSGQLEIKTKDPIDDAFDAFTVTLNYSPVNALSFGANPVVVEPEDGMEPADEFYDAGTALQLVDSPQPGKLVVTVILEEPVLVDDAGILPANAATHPTLFRLNTQISGGLTAGQIIDLSVSDFSLLSGADVLDVPDMVTGDITLELQSTLRITQVEALSDTQIRVQFSDYIQSLAFPVDYVILEDGVAPPLAVSTIESGTVYGYDQRTVVLTTDPQTPGQEYSLTVSGNVVSNSQGTLSDLYGSVLFEGYNGTVSDVTVTNVQVTSASSITVTFSGAINPATLTPVNMLVTSFTDPSVNLTSRSSLTVTNINCSSNTVCTLTTSNQTQNHPYFVMFNGVEDASGDPLTDNEPGIFFGYTPPIPTVTSVTPSEIVNNVSNNITLAGANLNLVETVRVDGVNRTITSQPANGTSLIFTLAAGLDPGAYNLTLIDENGTSTVVSNAVLASDPESELEVASSESLAIPYNVAPCGTTTLWALATHPTNTAGINSVTVNLSQIGGSTSVSMTPDGAAQQAGQQWYKKEITVSCSTPTSSTPYTLPVTVTMGSTVVNGTVSLRVTGDLLQGELPIINQFYVSPSSLPPDGTTTANVFVSVTDNDGIDTITSVIANLSSVGVGFVPLTAVNQPVEGGESVTAFYQSTTPFKVPKTTADGNYSVSVTVTDDTGNSVQSSINIQVSDSATGPKITSAYLSPRSTLINDGSTEARIHAFVTDPDGISDVSSVTADFGAIGIPPVPLKADTGGWYSSDPFTVPITANIGKHNVLITAVDKAGGTNNDDLEVPVSDEDTLGDAPTLSAKDSYTIPSVAPNDEMTQVSLYALVKDADDDITRVVVNMGNVGYLADDAEGNSQEGCDTGSNVFVCLKPSVKDDGGQWFVASDILIRKDTKPSSDPYMLKMTMEDSGGKTTHGNFLLYVNNGAGTTNDKYPPQLLTAITTSSTTAELAFSEELDPSSIPINGSVFQITDANDISKQLEVISATINASGTIVTLTTAPQAPGKQYMVTAKPPLKDAVGVTIVPGSGDRVPLIGFAYSGFAPHIVYASATSSTQAEMEFSVAMKPSTLGLGSKISSAQTYSTPISIRDEKTGAYLQITSIIQVNPRKVRITTANQIPDNRYVITAKNVEAYDGTRASGDITTVFKGFKGSPFGAGSGSGSGAGGGSNLIPGSGGCYQGDMNCDGKIDFTDFTLFAAIYGSSVGYPTSTGQGGTSGSGVGSGSPVSGQPFSPPSGATVPTNSAPAGGTIVP